MKRFGFAVVLSLAAVTAQAGSVEVNVSDDAARGTFAWPVLSERVTLDAGWLYHQDNGDIVSLGLQLADADRGNDSLSVGVGGKLFYFDPDEGTNPGSDNGTALGLGGFARYVFPNRLGLGGHLYFAPDVLSFGEARRYREAAVHVSFTVIPDADVYLGYRYIEAKFEGGSDYTLDEDVHVGLRLNF